MTGGNLTVNHAPAVPPEGRAFHGLELLRFLCALTIIVWHYQHFFMLDGHPIPGFDRPLQPLYMLFCIPYNWGYFAVEVFWGISGFVFFWKYADALYDRRVGGGKFFRLRFSRLYPLHIATLALVAGLQWIYTADHGSAFVYEYNDLRHLALQLAFASDWGFQKGPSFNGPVWSVSVEILAYAAFFLMARHWRFTGRSITTIILILVIAQILIPWLKDPVLCLLHFFVGGAVFLITRQSQRHKHSLASATLISTTALLFSNSRTDYNIDTLLLIYINILILSVFAMFSYRIASQRSRSTISFFSSLTYSSYMIHFPIQITAVTVSDHMGLGRDIYYHPAVFLAFLIASFTLAALSYIGFEYPMQQWLRSRMSERKVVPTQAEGWPTPVSMQPSRAAPSPNLNVEQHQNSQPQ